MIRQSGICQLAAMCSILNIPRSTFSQATDHEQEEEQLTAFISNVFRQSRGIYGQRQIKKELNKQGWRFHAAVLADHKNTRTCIHLHTSWLHLNQ
ncbi:MULTISPECIES: hypothetical protein [Shouchella]|uniref:hypothetical protein n=1 Tax=Shouchella TaxID=2893057 RepID=UPI000BA7B4E7|nr:MULTISPECIES: hypothetical protein [Shouchella]MCM3380285.1 hypothetical protein [Shouchella rhizosphaerae]PAD19587.1 hypothetical protein CHH73_00485 [Shouchella clausii]PAE85001.1 hypothetical protein CHH77_02480 [Shouchella clausii]